MWRHHSNSFKVNLGRLTRASLSRGLGARAGTFVYFFDLVDSCEIVFGVKTTVKPANLKLDEFDDHAEPTH